LRAPRQARRHAAPPAAPGLGELAGATSTASRGGRVRTRSTFCPHTPRKVERVRPERPIPERPSAAYSRKTSNAPDLRPTPPRTQPTGPRQPRRRRPSRAHRRRPDALDLVRHKRGERSNASHLGDHARGGVPKVVRRLRSRSPALSWIGGAGDHQGRTAASDPRRRPAVLGEDSARLPSVRRSFVGRAGSDRRPNASPSHTAWRRGWARRPSSPGRRPTQNPHQAASTASGLLPWLAGASLGRWRGLRPRCSAATRTGSAPFECDLDPYGPDRGRSS
jgi:hypothetical protein